MKKPNLFFGSVIFLLAASFLFYEMALQVSPSVMTHQLMLELQTNASVFGVIAAFYFYSYTIMQIPAGLLYDRYGSRLLITVSIFTCVVGALFFGSTHTVLLLSLGRLLMGIGSAFAFIGVLVVAARWFPLHYFAFLVGIAQLLAALGAMGGALPLAHAVNALGWRDVMLWLAGIGFCLALICFLVIRDRPKKQAEFEHYHIGFWKGLKEIISTPQTWWIGFYSFCSWAPVAVFAALWGVPYIMQRFDMINIQAAQLIAMIWLGIGLVSPFLGWFSDKLGERRILLWCCALIGCVCSILILYVPGIPIGGMYAILFGFGIAGAGQILTFALVKDITRPTVIGSAIGFNNMFVVVGGALLQPLVGWVLTLGWNGTLSSKGVPIYSLENYNIALMIVPICFLIGLIISLFFIKETYCKRNFDKYLVN